MQKTASITNEKSAEFDFFKDMEPVIESRSSKTMETGISTTNSTTNTTKLPNKNENEVIVIDSSRFAAAAINADDTAAAGDGWGMDDDDVEDVWKE